MQTGRSWSKVVIQPDVVGQRLRDASSSRELAIMRPPPGLELERNPKRPKESQPQGQKRSMESDTMPNTQRRIEAEDRVMTELREQKRSQIH